MSSSAPAPAAVACTNDVRHGTWTSAAPDKARDRLALVELFSVPGAGKTTLVRQAAKRSHFTTRSDLAAGWHQLPHLQKAFIAAQPFLNAASMARAVQFAVRTRCWPFEALLGLARILIKASWLRSRAGTLLVDQGLLQDLWSVLYKARCFEPDIQVTAKFLKSIYGATPACIVFIDVDPHTASTRISSRAGGHSRLDGLPCDEVERLLARAATLPLALAQAANSAGLRLERMNGRARVEALSEQLRDVSTREFGRVQEHA